MTEITVACIVDFAGEVDVSNGASPSNTRYWQTMLDLCYRFAQKHQGKVSIQSSDMVIVYFNGTTEGLSFAMHLHQLCVHGPAAAAAPIGIRVGLFSCKVESCGDSAVTTLQTDRIRKLTVGLLLIDQAILLSCKTLFGNDFVGFCGEHRIEPQSTEVEHVVDWQQCIGKFTQLHLGLVVYEHMKAAGIQLSNFNAQDFCNVGTVIWPIVPRQLATAIHRGQIELIRLLALLGWRVQVLIADCGDENSFSPKFLDNFESSLSATALRRNIAFQGIIRMSTLYDTSNAEYSSLQSLFKNISTRMTVAELISINNKEYSEDVKIELKSKTTLTYIRPPLTIAAVLHLAMKQAGKCAIVSGSDEALQWKQAYNETDAASKFGALMIPVIKMDKKHQVLQQKRWPIWDAIEELVEHLHDGKSNTAWWLFRLHGLLPAFPIAKVLIGSTEVSTGDWEDEMSIPEKVRLREFVDLVWPLLDPTNS